MNKKHYLQTISDISVLIKEQQVSPVDLVNECLERIETLNPTLNAFITVMGEQARADAKIAEEEIKAGKWRGPLHGIPVAFKDMYDTNGVKTTAAFEHFQNRVPKKDAAAVAKMKQAGAIIIGKTNMHTLAMGTTSQVSFYGPVHNPWNNAYISGGSSGGSAVAVAAGMCFATIDTDAVGSCRLPSSCCGVVGYKCTWGLIDNSGILDGEQADDVILKLATAGITTRDVADTSLIVDVLTNASRVATVQDARPTQRIGVVSNFGATDAVRSCFEQAVDVFEKIGFEMTTVKAPFDENPDMTRIDERRKTASDDVFGNVDVLILPTTATEVLAAANVGENPQALSPQNTFFANYYGLPAISVPCGFDENGLPIGFQIVGKQNDDAIVLVVAQAYQSATDWHEKHPIE